MKKASEQLKSVMGCSAEDQREIEEVITKVEQLEIKYEELCNRIYRKIQENKE